MKKILICGAGSYIGVSFEQYMAQFGDEYSIDTLDMQDASWREHSFSGYDCVYLVVASRTERKPKKTRIFTTRSTAISR